MILKNLKKALKMVLKTHLEPFREPLKVHLWDSQKKSLIKGVFFLSPPRQFSRIYTIEINYSPSKISQKDTWFQFGNEFKRVFNALYYIYELNPLLKTTPLILNEYF